MRMGRDRAGGEGAHLVAHEIERLIAERLAGPHPVRQQRGKRAAGFRRAALGEEARDRRMRGQRAGRVRSAERRGTHHFLRAHRQAGDNLRQVFAEADAQRQLFRRSEPPRAFGPRRPVRCRLERRDARRHPGKAVDPVLLAREQGRIGRALRRNHRRHRLPHRFAIVPRRPQSRARCHRPFAHGPVLAEPRAHASPADWRQIKSLHIGCLSECCTRVTLLQQKPRINPKPCQQPLSQGAFGVTSAAAPRLWGTPRRCWGRAGMDKNVRLASHSQAEPCGRTKAWGISPGPI